MNGTRGFIPGLIDLASGQISREIFVDDDIYPQEQERIFARCLGLHRTRDAHPQSGRFFPLADGRGVGHPDP